MASGFIDSPMGVRALTARTNSAGTAVTDITASEERLANIFVDEGWISPSDAFEVVADSSWNVLVGSGTVKTDLYVVEGDVAGQGAYIVRLDDATDTLAIDPSDVSNPRWDEIYLVVLDNTYDASGLSLPRLAVRTGDPASSPALPGPAAAWKAYVKLAEIYVPASAADITECTIVDTREQSQSTVDAQTLGGNAIGAFSLATHNHDADYADGGHDGSTDGHPNAVASGASGLMTAADKSKLNAIETGAEANLSASEILTLIKTVDGAGSVLDADTLDGTGRSGFADAGHNHDTRYYTESEINTDIAAKGKLPVRARGYKTSDSAITSTEASISGLTNTGDWTAVSGGLLMHDNAAGWYLVTLQVAISANSTAGNIRQARLWHSDLGNCLILREAPVTSSGEATVLYGSVLLYMDGSDYVRAYAYQDSGATNYVLATNTFIEMTYLGG